MVDAKGTTDRAASLEERVRGEKEAMCLRRRPPFYSSMVEQRARAHGGARRGVRPREMPESASVDVIATLAKISGTAERDC